MKPLTSVPGPPALPIVGHLPEFLNDKLGFLSRCTARYGEVVKLKIGKTTFLLTNPEDIRYVLVTNRVNYTKTRRITSKGAQHELGNGLLTSTETGHLKQRRMLQPVFHRKMMEGSADMIVAAVEDHISGWKSGQTIDMAYEMKTLGQRVMLRALFGDDMGVEMDRLQRAAGIRRKYYEHLLGAVLPFPQYQPVRTKLEYYPASRYMDKTIHRAIKTKRDSGNASQDLLTAFIQARYDDGSAMTDEQIRIEALTFIDTGYDTIAAALAWTWYLLAQHPDIQSKLSNQLKENFAGAPVGAGDLPRLSYLQKVLNESFRLYPPTWMFVRVAQRTDRLPSGAVIPAGTRLYICPYLVHRNPTYFPEPERFDPERFSETHELTRPKFAFFPFGGGAHVCIGEPFARLECLLVLATIGQRFGFEVVPGQKVVPYPGINLKSKYGIRLRIAEAGQLK